jgi:hypothetical protein
MKLKAKQPKQEASPVAALPLAERLKQACADAEAHIESKVQELKASADGRILSVDWLSQDLRRRHGGNCSCRVALSLLQKESNNGR